MRSLKKYIFPLVLVLMLSLLSGCQEDVSQTTAPDLTLPVPGGPTYYPTRPTEPTPGETDPLTTAAPTTEEALAFYPFAPETTGIYLTRDGEIQSAEITEFSNEGFSAPRYSMAELRIFVDRRVTAYNTAKGSEAIKVVDLSQKDKNAQLILSYASLEDFMAFQGEEFGVQHLALMGREDAIRNYEISGLTDASGKKAEILKALQARDSKVLIITGKTHITVNGNIGYLSDNLILTGVNSARCDSDQGYSFIIFR